MSYEVLVTTMLGVLVAVLSWIAINIHEMAKNLSGMAEKVAHHDRRLTKLEERTP